MISIGQFARLGQVSVATVRHYDAVGLLTPEAIDEFTGYRYYRVGQLARLHKVLALKDLGLSLRQIKDLLDGLTVEELAGMLRRKREQTEEVVAAEQERLVRIDAHLELLELERSMPDHDVILKTAPAQLIASRRITVPTNADVSAHLGEAYRSVSALARQAGAMNGRPCLAIWHQPADVYENEVVEAAVPISGPVQAANGVDVYELPSTLVASLIHQGDYAGFRNTHVALLRWIEANGYQPSGTYREVYLQEGTAGDSTGSVTEIQYPVIASRPG